MQFNEIVKQNLLDTANVAEIERVKVNKKSDACRTFFVWSLNSVKKATQQQFQNFWCRCRIDVAYRRRMNYVVLRRRNATACNYASTRWKNTVQVPCNKNIGNQSIAIFCNYCTLCNTLCACFSSEFFSVSSLIRLVFAYTFSCELTITLFNRSMPITQSEATYLLR